MNFPHPLMAPAVELALKAGEAILPFWRIGTAVTAKADDSPVTAADLAAHHVILAGLTALDPSIPVLSEEDANIPQSVRAGWQRWWLVDPLDGTKEFISGSEEFTVNIALIEQGRVVFGVVSMPTNGRFYVGGAGLGAWRCDQGGTPVAIQVRDVLAPGQSFTVVASRRHSSPEQERLLAGLSASLGELRTGQYRQLSEVLPVGRGGGGLLSAPGADFAVGHGGGSGRAGRGGWRGAGSEWCAVQLSGAGVAFE